MSNPIRPGNSGNLANVSAEKTWSANKTWAAPKADTDSGLVDKAADAIQSAAQVQVYNGKSSFDAGAPMHTVNGTGPAGIQTSGYFQGPHFDLNTDASASAGLNGVDVDVNVHVDASAVKAGASAEKDVHFTFQGQDFDVKVKLGADGEVGANGDLKVQLHLGPNGVSANLGADGFAGAKGTLSGTIELDANGKTLASSQAAVTFAAGVGAGAHFDAGLDHFHASAYATVGAGVGFDLSGNVDYGNVAGLLPKLVSPSALLGDAKDLGSAGLHAAGNLVGDAKNLGAAGVHAAGNVVHDVTNHLPHIF